MPPSRKSERASRNYSLRQRPGAQQAQVENTTSRGQVANTFDCHQKKKRPKRKRILKKAHSDSCGLENSVNCDILDSLHESSSNANTDAAEKVLKAQIFLSTLSCNWCCNTFKGNLSSHSPVQLKPCNHLVCYRCIKSMMQVAFEASLASSSIICQKKNCTRKITRLWINKAIIRILDEFMEQKVDHFTCNEQSGQLSQVEEKRFRLLTDLNISKKSIATFNQISQEADGGRKNSTNSTSCHQSYPTDHQSERINFEDREQQGETSRSFGEAVANGLIARIRRNAFGSFMENLDFFSSNSN